MKPQSIRSFLTCAACVVAFAAFVTPAGATVSKAVQLGKESVIPGRYIVVLKDSIEHPGAVANTQVDRSDGKLSSIYRSALKGYAAKLSKQAVDALRSNPAVKYVEPDRTVEMQSQTVPTGVSRIFGTNPGFAINGYDDARVNADIAIIDTGIDYQHPDLNVVRRVNCASLETETTECVENSGTDTNGHGTHVAGIAAALDNEEGVVGVAPGARLWAVKVASSDGGLTSSDVAAGIDWVTAHAGEIEVANVSLGCVCGFHIPVFDEAIEASVDAGVVYAVAAGNSHLDVETQSPANSPDVIAVSNLSDYDGKPGGLAAQLWRPSCQAEKQSETESQRGPDDTLTITSDFGSGIDLAAPGSCIYSTWKNGEFKYESGTSMASPYVAGAAAILASQKNPNSRADVEAIRTKLEEAGNYDWEDTSGDGIQEPLLDVSHLFVPEVATGTASGLSSTSATVHGTVNPLGAATSYYFEYDTSGYLPGEAPHGTSVPVSPKSAGSGVGGVSVSEAVEGLKPATTYHYRVVAGNANNSAYGEDMTFSTWASWSTQSTPNPTATPIEGKLEGVSCKSSTMCLAVGEDKQRERVVGQLWNGSEWANLPFVEEETLPGSRTAVSCTSTTSCEVVGSQSGAPVAERWRSPFGTWSREPHSVPSPEGGSEVKLRGVSCTASTACTAVGSYLNEGKTKTLAERWNGSSWSIQTTPNPESGSAELNGVSCDSATSCTAVGKAGAGPYAMRWNGSAWSAATVPNPSGATEASLQKVSCTSGSFCLAVGTYKESSGYNKTLAEKWNGSSWSVASTPNPAEAKGSFLTDVSCTSSSSCIAAGRYNTALEAEIIASEAKTLVESWGGSEWQIQSSPNPAGKKLPRLNGVSCFASNACTAVGWAKKALPEAETTTLGERYE